MDKVWEDIKKEVNLRIEAEPSLSPYLDLLILSQDSLISSIASVLASKLNSDALSSSNIKEFILDAYMSCENIENSLREDLIYFVKNDPACKYYSTPILFYKGYQGLATYRAANCLWKMIDIRWHYFYRIGLLKFLELIFIPLHKLKAV